MTSFFSQCYTVSMKCLFPFFCVCIAFSISVWAETTQTTVSAGTAPVVTTNMTYPCGRQPKQVLFSPDGAVIVLPLLDDTGFQVLSVTGDKTPLLIQPPRSDKRGFAEGLFIPGKSAFFVSQMTTGHIYEYTYPGFKYRREIACGGEWPKFIAWSSDTELLAVSNWISNTVSLIDYTTGAVVRVFKTKAAPRGLAFTEKGSAIIVLCFDGGVIQKFKTDTGTLSSVIPIEKSALRHIVVNRDETAAYISDMYHATVYRLDLALFKITATYHVFNNPNTIALYKDRYLFVSCRGPNNKEDYTKRSPVNGKIMCIDTQTGASVCTIPGGNQPTGLGVSPDGTMLCFSNFQDADIELCTLDGNACTAAQ